jgi:hypothetical protein
VELLSTPEDVAGCSACHKCLRIDVEYLSFFGLKNKSVKINFDKAVSVKNYTITYPKT